MAGSRRAITDINGDRWTITRGDQVAFDGVPIAITSNVLEVAYAAGVVWEETSAGWYSIVDTNGAFSFGRGPIAALPLPPAAPATPTPTLTATSAAASASTSTSPPLSLVSLTTATGGHMTIDGSIVGTVTLGADTFAMLGNGVAAVVLGSPGQTLRFIGMSQVTVSGSAGDKKDVVTADSGTNTFIAGAGPMKITGGSGVDTYIFKAGSGAMTITDFSVSSGDKLIIGANLSASMKTGSDGAGGTLISFSGAGSIDLKSVAALPSSSIEYVVFDPAPNHP